MTDPTPLGTEAPGGHSDLRAEVLAGAQMLAQPHPSAGRGTTSDLSIDEALLLHSIGWEPVDLVFGSSLASVPVGSWNWGQGEIGGASQSWGIAFDAATSRLAEQCAGLQAHGVVGVAVEAEVHRLHVDVELVGTAVRPVKNGKGPANPFASDLSARDFVLLHGAGWQPVGLAFGASFVYVPRRSMGTTIRQTSQNVELTNFTEAMYSAREAAMARLQNRAVALGAAGIVAVVVGEGPMRFANHAIGFTAWGTAIVLQAQQHRRVVPRVILPLDDARVAFEAASLRKAGEP